MALDGPPSHPPKEFEGWARVSKGLEGGRGFWLVGMWSISLQSVQHPWQRRPIAVLLKHGTRFLNAKVSDQGTSMDLIDQ